MITLRAFRALWPASYGRASAADFLFAEPSDPDAPSVHRLCEMDRRETDRSRFVTHMRTAALLAAWRREGVFVASDQPKLFAWQRGGQIMAISGLADLDDLPLRALSPAVVRDTKARLEALGAVFELPILTAPNLPDLSLQTLYDTPQGSLCSVLDLEQVTLSADAATLSGSEIAGALGLIFEGRAERGGSTPVWIRSGTHEDFHPPIGALFWPWVDEPAEALL